MVHHNNPVKAGVRLESTGFQKCQEETDQPFEAEAHLNTI
jgi:hypothetical protein